MEQSLYRCLERTIKQSFVSVQHDYDSLETIYSFPYNIRLTPTDVKLEIIRATGLDYDDDFDETDPANIETKAGELLESGFVPMFYLYIGHTINKKNELLTHYSITFDEAGLIDKMFRTKNLTRKNKYVKLAQLCAKKIVAQENEALENKMEKMFIPENVFVQASQNNR